LDSECPFVRQTCNYVYYLVPICVQEIDKGCYIVNEGAGNPTNGLEALVLNRL